MKKFNQLYTCHVTLATREFKNRIIQICDKVGYPTDWNMGKFVGNDDNMYILLDEDLDSFRVGNNAPTQGLISMEEFEERFVNAYAGDTTEDELRMKRSFEHRVFPATTVAIEDQQHMDELMQACYDHGIEISVGPKYDPTYPILLVDEQLRVCTTKIHFHEVSSKEFYARLGGKGEFTPHNVKANNNLLEKRSRGNAMRMSGNSGGLAQFLAGL